MLSFNKEMMMQGWLMATALALVTAGAAAQDQMRVEYGEHRRQAYDLTLPEGATKAPVMLFIHGGGWVMGDKRRGAGEKAAHFNAQGWAFATTNYRLVPDATVEEQAADVAAAIADLAERADVDGRTIVLMGHSAGAHLAALVATDRQYLAAQGLGMDAVDGVVLLDGAGYDVPARLAASERSRRLFLQVFSDQPERQWQLSPQAHVAAPNAQRWLIMPVQGRPISNAQSEALGAALRQAGNDVTLAAMAGETHSSINRGFGEAGDEATALVDVMLAQIAP